MITASFGMKCPFGHEAVQVSASMGAPRCSVCGATMDPNLAAAPVGVNRTCPHCRTFIGMLSHDTGRCPTCGQPWS